MANYVLPTFNINCDLFTAGNFANPARGTIAGNLTPGRREVISGLSAAGLPLTAGSMYLLLPPLTDIRGPLQAGGADGVEIPPASGRKYLVVWVDDIAKGFPNEHRFAVLTATGVWPTPIP